MDHALNYFHTWQISYDLEVILHIKQPSAREAKESSFWIINILNEASLKLVVGRSDFNPHSKAIIKLELTNDSFEQLKQNSALGYI